MKGMILSDLLKPNFHNPNQQLRVSLPFAFVISPIKDWAAKVSLSCTSCQSSNLWKRIFCQKLCMTKTTSCPFYLSLNFFPFLISWYKLVIPFQLALILSPWVNIPISISNFHLKHFPLFPLLSRFNNAMKTFETQDNQKGTYVIYTYLSRWEVKAVQSSGPNKI